MADLPLVLAGPIIRRIEPRLCAFWIALKEPAAVTVKLWSGIRNAGAALNTVEPAADPLSTGQANTKRFGQRLHVAVVTVKLDSAAGQPPLTPATLYSYNVSFGSNDLRNAGLLRDETTTQRLPGVAAQAPLHLALGYEPNRLPSFVTPAGTTDRLRVAHTSCRKPHGPRCDAQAWIDDQLKETLLNPDLRPQQLFLTGDQIYADSVAATLLPMLIELGKDLIGADENLPLEGSNFTATAANFPPLRRERLLQEKGGFTTTAADNHLMSFAEFAAMYLAVWSSRVWRALPEAASLFTPIAGLPQALRDSLTAWEKAFDNSLDKWKTARVEGVDNQKREVERFASTVPKVARGLANIATYMIMDDHEITDDWNLNRKWRNRVYTKPIARSIIRNGLMAYGVFQGWGNDPAAFDSGKNKEFLDETVAVLNGAGPLPAAPTAKLEELVGLNETGADKQVKWHYRVPGPRHLVVVLDSRTHRSFTGQGFLPPDLLGATLNDQLPNGPLTDGRELLLVISPAPVLGPAILDHFAQPVMQNLFDIKSNVFGKMRDDPHDPLAVPSFVGGAEEYDAEGWAANEEAFEKLLARLATYPISVLLSGDVHYGGSLYLDYWRKGVATPSRIVQFTASAAHNTFDDRIAAVLRDNARLQVYELGDPAERLAWTAKAPLNVPAGTKLSPARRARMGKSPALLPSTGWPAAVTLPADKPPDWRWRMRLLRDERPDSALPAPLRQPMGTAADELNVSNPLPAYRSVVGRHALAAMTHFDHVRQVVFTCNVGLVSWATESAKLQVTHTLLSQDAPDSPRPAPNTVHKIELAPSTEAPPTLRYA